ELSPVRLDACVALFDSDAEEVARPPGEQIVDEHEEDEQGQQYGHQAQADTGQPPIQAARLLLLRHGALLELDHALKQRPILGELIALSITHVAQEMPDVVVAIHSRGAGLPRRDILASSQHRRPTARATSTRAYFRFTRGSSTVATY